MKGHNADFGARIGSRWWGMRGIFSAGALVVLLAAVACLAKPQASNDRIRLAAPDGNSVPVMVDKIDHPVTTRQPYSNVELTPRFVETSPGESPVPPSLPAAGPSATHPAEATPLPSTEPTRSTAPTQVEFSLLTEFEASRMLFVGAGGDIDGIVSPDLVVSPGTIVRVNLINGDGIAHDIYFPDYGAQSQIIGRKDQTTAVTFTVPEDFPSGAYVYYCTRSGHREAGQEGWLIVDGGR